MSLQSVSIRTLWKSCLVNKGQEEDAVTTLQSEAVSPQHSSNNGTKIIGFGWE